MAYNKRISPNVMTRKGQSSRWDYRAYVKEVAKKNRRRADKKECDAKEG